MIIFIKQLPLKVIIKWIMRLKAWKWSFIPMWLMGRNWFFFFFLSTTAHTNRNHKEILAPFTTLKPNTTPPVQCPAEQKTGGYMHHSSPLCKGFRADKDQNKTAMCFYIQLVLYHNYSSVHLYSYLHNLTPLNFWSTEHEQVQSYDTIWPGWICYQHHFSGDKLMHRPNFLETVAPKDFFPLTEIEQVNGRVQSEISQF